MPKRDNYADIRVENARIRDVEGRNTKLFKHNFRHSLPVGRCVPGGFSDENRMLFRRATHDVRKRMLNERWDTAEVVYCEMRGIFVNKKRDILSLTRT